MSLSARIVVHPSRGLAVLESLVAAGGLCVAAAGATARWPAWGSVIGLIVVAALVLLAQRRRRTEATLIVSDRPEVGLSAVDGGDASWRVAEGTMVWPGFAVVALASEGNRLRTLPVLDRDLTPDDRRALHRFLLWTLRGGSGRRVADA